MQIYRPDSNRLEVDCENPNCYWTFEAHDPQDGQEIECPECHTQYIIKKSHVIVHHYFTSGDSFEITSGIYAAIKE